VTINCKTKSYVKQDHVLAPLAFNGLNPITMDSAARIICALIPQDSIIVSELLTAHIPFQQYLPYSAPHDYLFGPMGGAMDRVSL